MGFVEAIMRRRESADSAVVEAWLAEHHVTAVPMRAGWLLQGSPEQLAKAFNSEIVLSEEGSASLRPPKNLEPHISSITIPNYKMHT